MEKEVLVLMLLSVFSLMSLALSPTKNYILERQMLDACGIQAIANISRMQWQSGKDHVLRGYDFAYDGLNRLEESTYAEGADMSQNKSSFDNNQNPTFHYYEKDHLGSIRMVVNENGTIEQVNHYYPFGGVYGDLSYNSETQRNKYIGKEFDHMHGLDWYDHGARMYDAARVAWDKTERLYGKFNNWNLYCYGLDNPIKFIDKDGREPGDFFESPEKAALDFALFYNDNSIRDNKEFASSIYAVQNDNGDRGYTYTLPNVGQENHCIPSLPTLGSFLVAIVHTHGSATSSDGTIYANNEFSGSTMTRYGKKMPVTNLKNVTQKRTDIYQANYLKVDSYLATPNGSLLKYDYKRGKISVISTETPSDVTDKTRKNDISTSENYEIDADALRRMIDKLLRLNTNSHLIFK